MDNIKEKIGQGGLILAAMGAMSMILTIFNYELRLLKWIDMWGTSMGWVIRVALIVVGGAIFFFLGNSDEE